MKKVAYILLLLVFCSCTANLPDKDELISRMYEERVAQLYISKDAECQERVLEDAEAHVDSLIDQWINADLMDTLVFPSRPIKPNTPDHIIGTVKRFDKDSLN